MRRSLALTATALGLVLAVTASCAQDAATKTAQAAAPAAAEASVVTPAKIDNCPPMDTRANSTG
jgi:protein involved in sex pheromone biosynthesis